VSEPRGPSRAGILATVGLAAAALLCCAGPALLAGGALSGLGGLLRNPWLIGGGAAVIVAAVGYAIARHTHGRGGAQAEDCCPPQETEGDTHR